MRVSATVKVGGQEYEVDAKVTPQADDFYETEVIDVVGPDGLLSKDDVSIFVDGYGSEIDAALIKVAVDELQKGDIE